MPTKQQALANPDSLINAVLKCSVRTVHVALAQTHRALVVGIITRAVALPGLAVLLAVPPRGVAVSASEFTCEHKETRVRLGLWSSRGCVQEEGGMTCLKYYNLIGQEQ